MLIDRCDPEDVFARVPELAEQTDPVLVQLDRLVDDDQVSAPVRADLGHRYQLTLVHGRHATPAEVLLRLLVVQHLDSWSYQETVERVAHHPPGHAAGAAGPLGSAGAAGEGDSRPQSAHR